MISAIIALKYNPKRIYSGITKEFLNITLSINSLLYNDIIREIIIVNNTTSHDKQLKYIKTKYGNHDKIKIIEAHNNGLFNKCWLLNIGIKQLSQKLFMLHDIDCIISPNFENIINPHVDDILKRKMFICFPLYSSNLKNNWIEFKYPSSFYDTIKDGTHYPSPSHILCHVEEIKSINGYDEVYQMWGPEDHDISIRLSRHLLMYDYVEGHIHQSHSNYLKYNSREHASAIFEKNKKYFKAQKIITRNIKGWGETQGPNDRINNNIFEKPRIFPKLT